MSLKRTKTTDGPQGAFIADGDLREQIRTRTLRLADELPPDVLRTTVGLSALLNITAHVCRVHNLSADDVCDAMRAALTENAT